eukprot:GHVN01096349.1.p1 GENE.GHVN01096349.1~~GHVN01096349.1.p1  ORF type:complete len:160 (+),score=19.45 GHVN01096349.1:27-482(+)
MKEDPEKQTPGEQMGLPGFFCGKIKRRVQKSDGDFDSKQKIVIMSPGRIGGFGLIRGHEKKIKWFYNGELDVREVNVILLKKKDNGFEAIEKIAIVKKEEKPEIFWGPKESLSIEEDYFIYIGVDEHPESEYKEDTVFKESGTISGQFNLI